MEKDVEDQVQKCIMTIPPLWSTVRVNTLQLDVDEARKRMEALLAEQYQMRHRLCGSVPVVLPHPRIPDLLLIRGNGPKTVIPVEKEIYVDKDCGCAVMRGADIYVPGVLASNENFHAGDIVSVYMVDGRCRRGLKQHYDGKLRFLGNGRTMFSRTDIFSVSGTKSVSGIGILMTDPVWDNPRFDSATIDNWGFVQNLPSVVCGHLLDPQPGEMVLDMCAAPGGKSTHIATLMKDQGTVVCVDTSSNRVEELRRNAERLSLKSIEAYQRNANGLCEESSSIPKSGPTFPAESFDRILLDAPCSCTGQRPFVKNLPEKQKLSHVPLQRRLLETAYKLLKRGGVMVYSTCSLEPEENENQIKWFLRMYQDMTLAPQKLVTGQEVAVNGHQGTVQKFDPRMYCSKRGMANDDRELNRPDGEKEENKPHVPEDYDRDTIGFFIAKMMKQ